MNEELWIPQGITKEFDVNSHMIWKIYNKEDGIQIPEGYHEIKTDDVIIKHKFYSRTFFVNDVPVEAELYKNKSTNEISYYFAGTPIKLNKGKAITKTK